MEPDEEPDDDRSSGPLLPPDDRLWRHPSEMSAGHSRSAVAVAQRGMWTVALLAGAVGALLATGVSFATGSLRTRTIHEVALEEDISAPVVTVASAGAGVALSEDAAKVQRSCVVITNKSGGATKTSGGVVFRSDGMVLTTAHSVAGATTLTAVVGGTRRVTARVIATDTASDLAVVKLDGSGFPTAPLGSALDVRVGDPVVALAPAPSTGSNAKVVAEGDQVSTATAELGDQLRITTVPSMVGAPVIDNRGAVIGIVTALGNGDGFATPVDLARQVAQQLIANGKVVPVWLGVSGYDLTAASAKQLSLGGGAVISKVQDSSPASTAGLKPGDVVYAVNGRAITSMAVLIMALHSFGAGSTVDLDVMRGQGEMFVRVVLEPRPPES